MWIDTSLHDNPGSGGWNTADNLLNRQHSEDEILNLLQENGSNNQIRLELDNFIKLVN